MSSDDAAFEMGVQLARDNVPAFAAMYNSLSAAERVTFVRGFLACFSGMAHRAIGHAAAVDALVFAAGLPPSHPACAGPVH